MEDYDIPVAFYFNVEMYGKTVSFKEVSGLDLELECETIPQGGVRENELILPKKIKHKNLVLKRALNKKDMDFFKWIYDLHYGLNNTARPIELTDIIVSLLDASGSPIYKWICRKAYPVKWSIDPLNSTKNDVLTESLEFAYGKLDMG
jgi:conserved hypothetical phage tail region protein